MQIEFTKITGLLFCFFKVDPADALAAYLHDFTRSFGAMMTGCPDQTYEPSVFQYKCLPALSASMAILLCQRSQVARMTASISSYWAIHDNLFVVKRSHIPFHPGVQSPDRDHRHHLSRFRELSALILYRYFWYCKPITWLSLYR